MKMFDEYRGISYERASREAIRIIRAASESQIWTDLPERLLHLRSILQCMGDWNQPKKPTEDTEPIAEQLRECTLRAVDGSALFCEAPISLLERAANRIVASEVIESYRRRWSSHTIDGAGWAEAAFEPMSNNELFSWARREGGPVCVINGIEIHARS